MSTDSAAITTHGHDPARLSRQQLTLEFTFVDCTERFKRTINFYAFLLGTVEESDSESTLLPIPAPAPAPETSLFSRQRLRSQLNTLLHRPRWTRLRIYGRIYIYLSVVESIKKKACRSRATFSASNRNTMPFTNRWLHGKLMLARRGSLSPIKIIQQLRKKM